MRIILFILYSSMVGCFVFKHIPLSSSAKIMTRQRVYLDDLNFDEEDERELAMLTNETDLDAYTKLILGIPQNISLDEDPESLDSPDSPPPSVNGVSGVNSGANHINRYKKKRHSRQPRETGIQIIFRSNGFETAVEGEGEGETDNIPRNEFRRSSNKVKKSDHFEIIEQSPFTFKDIGGYENIKLELFQCVDILKNHAKYAKYNVRTPKGLILEGPPGNGKTLLAKGFAGECGVGFIAVSGSEFQDKYVGVGSSRVRELFQLAQKNRPCIVFIDEIDAIGRSRSKENDEGSSAERDSTLNELLVALDGFKNNSGVFIIGATNRADMLDDALMRPGRIDKRIYIGLPDEKTRRAILNIHIQGKPFDSSVSMENMVDMTSGFSGAQIENILNEALLNALRHNKECGNMEDIELVINKMMVGWQPNEHEMSKELIQQICIHEMGHAMVGLYCKNHAKVKKVNIDLSSPKSPGYTRFEDSKTSIYTKKGLFEHLAILLGGRIAEELFYGVGSTTNGAISDFEEAFKLANKMVNYYGMGRKMIYSTNSDRYKEMVDDDVVELIQSAGEHASDIITKHRYTLEKGARILEQEKVLSYEDLIGL
jgi:cell division protease FtsH